MDQNARQREVVKKLLGKAKPPPVLYRYRRPNEWTINEIVRHEIYLPRPQDMNDPFEYQAPLVVDLKVMKAVAFSYFQKMGMTAAFAREEADRVDEATARMLLQGINNLSKSSGIICCSKTSLSNRMWAYYADAHKGICIFENKTC